MHSDTPETHCTFSVLEATFVAWAKGELYLEDVIAVLSQARSSTAKVEIERDEARRIVESFRACAESKFGPMPFPRKFHWENACLSHGEGEKRP